MPGTSMRKILIILALFFFACDNRESLMIFHAGSLSQPMADLATAFNKKHPALAIKREAAGSRETARKISELYRLADVVAVSDYKVIEELLMPDHADWQIKFARNQMVIAFTERSKYASEIDSNNWYRILMREDVRFGRSDENLDPCGYRTLMVWKLADLYYKEKMDGKSIYEALNERCPENNIRPSEIELLPLLESLFLDYAFEYLSIAVQHRLRYIELPQEIDLTNPRLDSLYSKVSVRITGKKRGEFQTVVGSPIVYGISIPKDAPNRPMAIKFIQFLLGDEGRKILSRNGQPPLTPPVAAPVESIPEELKGFFGE
ncbi:tungstate ABC transporter substrate-binding protein WtpA [candidate division KSB1 bacterium]|nr:tungstate ABC transporter substrate-binding protein WtpA [candidate division KSB1 bacterium]